MISRYCGRVFALEKLRELTEIGKEGVYLLGISDAAEKIGFQTSGLKLSFAKTNRRSSKAYNSSLGFKPSIVEQMFIT